MYTFKLPNHKRIWRASYSIAHSIRLQTDSQYSCAREGESGIFRFLEYIGQCSILRHRTTWRPNKPGPMHTSGIYKVREREKRKKLQPWCTTKASEGPRVEPKRQSTSDRQAEQRNYANSKYECTLTIGIFSSLHLIQYFSRSQQVFPWLSRIVLFSISEQYFSNQLCTDIPSSAFNKFNTFCC